MAILSAERWDTLAAWSAIAFLVAGVIFAADAAVLAVNIVAGTDPPLTLGQTLVGAGWTAAFIGVLGVYPRLANRTRWFARVGVIFAVIGAITMAIMAVTAFGYFTGFLNGALSEVVMFFLPGVFLGIVLGFGSFGVTSLQSTTVSRPVSLLFLLLPVTFLFNLGTGIAGFNPLAKVLGVVCVLTLVMLAIGYLLRTGNALDRNEVETPGGPSAG